jgi:hypothetical protein
MGHSGFFDLFNYQGYSHSARHLGYVLLFLVSVGSAMVKVRQADSAALAQVVCSKCAVNTS